MSEFEKGLKRYLTDDQFKQIRNARIGIAGAGGLGSNCAMNLVRCGFSEFIVADYDIVENSNLNRQFFFTDQIGMSKVSALRENLLRISPGVRMETLKLKLEKENIGAVFETCDVIVEAVDETVYKKMIVETFMNSGKLLVAASGIGGWGRSDGIVTSKIRDRFYMAGDSVSEVSETCPPMAPTVMIAAAKQADIVLDYVLAETCSGGKE